MIAKDIEDCIHAKAVDHEVMWFYVAYKSHAILWAIVFQIWFVCHEYYPLMDTYFYAGITYTLNNSEILIETKCSPVINILFSYFYSLKSNSIPFFIMKSDTILFFIIINMDVHASLRASQIIPRVLKLTTM